MKKTFLFLCFLYVQITYAQIPSFEKVVNSFFHKYSIEAVEANYYLSFQKRKEGWFTAEVNYSDQDGIINQQLFWSKSENKFYQLTYEKIKDISKDSVQKLILRNSFAEKILNDSYNFSRNIYFGYPGWDKDVIDDYAEIEILNDTLLESLGRAYSSYAIGFFTIDGATQLLTRIR